MDEITKIFGFLVNNLAIMFTMSLLYGFIVRRNNNKLIDKLVFGLFFSITVLAAMLDSYRVENGPIFDCRSVILGVCGMFAGPVAIIPMIAATCYRIFMGNPVGTSTGVLVIITSTVLGIIFYYLRKSKPHLIGGWYLYGLGLLIHIMMSLYVFLMPHENMVNYYKYIFPTVIIIFPIAMVIFSRIMLHQEHVFENQRRIVALNQELQDANTNLIASQQQLRAANQQLMASDQQLRASNQQLGAANQQLRANEAELQWLARFPAENPNPVVRVLYDGSIVYQNNASVPLLESWGGRLSNQLSGKWLELIVKARDCGSIIQEDVRCGEKIYLVTIVPIAGYDYANLYGIDVTAARKSAAALRESEEIFNQYLNNSPVLVYIKDENLKVVKASSSFEELLGKSTSEIIGKESHELFPAEFADSITADDRKVLSQGVPVKTEESFGGRIYTTIKFPIYRGEGKPDYLGGITVDITDRKRVEEILRAERDYSDNLIRTTPVAVCGVASDGACFSINTAGEQITGYSADEIIGKNWWKTFYPGQDYQQVEKLFKDMSGKEVRDYQMTLTRKDGTKRVMSWNSLNRRNIEGNLITYGFGYDITEIHKAREILEKYNRQLEDDVRQRTAELSEKNSQLQQEISERIKAEQTLKAAQSQLIESEKMVSIGRLAAGIAHELNTPLGAIGSTQATLRSSFDSIMSSCQKIYGLPQEDVDVVKTIIGRLSVQGNSMLTTRQRREVIKTISDELSGRGIENSQEIAQFLLEIGLLDDYQEFLPRLAGGNGSEIRDYCGKVANVTQGLHVIDSAINQSSRIAFALREYARTDENRAAEMFDVSRTLETAIILYGNKIKHGIDLSVNFATVPCIMGYSNELCQVWTNLIHNAVQAMDGVGRLEIDLRRKDDFVVVTIKDSGCGIAPEIIGKIFDPLFTTKPVGIGTGLGLDIARRIVQRHNGTISVESQPGMGATFTVQLPIK